MQLGAINQTHVKNLLSAPVQATPLKEAFKAEYPEHMKKNLLQKILHLAYNIFSVAFFPLGICRLIKDRLHLKLGELIVPAQDAETDHTALNTGRKGLLTVYHGTSAILKTPDGVFLDAMHIPGKKTGGLVSKNAPTIIYFNGNGEKYENHGLILNIKNKNEISKPEIKEKAKIKFSSRLTNLADYAYLGYNVLLFNYRGVEKSTGKTTRDGLWLDGETALQYAHNHLGVPKEHIILFGHSLGGGVATKVAADNPGVQLLNERSFATLSKVPKVTIGKVSPFMGKIAYILIKILGWELDSLSNWKKVKGKKWIAFHKEDYVIPYKTSLHHALKAEKQKKIPATLLITCKEPINAYYRQRTKEKKERELTVAEKKLVDSTVEDIKGHGAHNRKLLKEEFSVILSHFAGPFRV